MITAVNVSKRALLSWLLPACVLCVCWAWGNASAQTNTAKASGPADRYLLIVETSRLMERRSDGVQQTVRNVLGSTLGKELRQNASIGVWTYNEKLNAGRFPVQSWAPAARSSTLAAISGFLAKEKYEKKPHLDQVLPALANIIASSPVLTVILISSGTEEIHGTPFDESVNSTFKQWREQQQTERMPFVTIFRAARGKMTGYAVAPAPWPLAVPPLPESPKPSVAQVKAVAPENKAVAPASTVPPLIVSGRKPQPVATNAAPESAMTKLVPSTPATRANATLVATSETTTQTAKAFGNVETSLAQTTVTGGATPPSSNRTEPPPGAQAMSSPTPASPAVKEQAQVSPSAGPDDKKPAPTVAQLAGKEPEPKSDNAGAAAEAANLAASSGPSSPASSPAQAAALPAPRSVPNMALIIGAVICLVGGIGLFSWARGRSRPQRPASLITRSLDRKD